MKIVLLVPIFFLLGGCGLERAPLSFKEKESARKINPLTYNTPLSFQILKQKILTPKCLSCHSGHDAEPENDPIDFTSYEVMMKERFNPLLVKGDPFDSRLYESVESGDMPEKEMLSKIEIDYIRRWILACAPKMPISVIPDQCDGDDVGKGLAYRLRRF